MARRRRPEGYPALRETFGGVLLLGLEILVAALIRTVAVSPTLRNVAVLGLIVVIRTFLSFSLQVEIDGQLPWRRFLANGVATGKEIVKSSRPLDGTRDERDIRNEACRRRRVRPTAQAAGS